MMEYKDLSEEQRAKVAGAHTLEDILRIAKEEGYELSDEEVQQVSGGVLGWENSNLCPKCGSRMVHHHYHAICQECHYIEYD